MAAIYVINSFIGMETNYWYVNFKPEGDSIMNWMRPEPYHMIDIYHISSNSFMLLLYTFIILFDKDRKLKIMAKN